MTVESLLQTGRDHPVRAAELSEKLQVNKRTVYEYIRRERAAGALIIGCNDGYYLAENDDDLEAFVARSRARGAQTIAAGKMARRELKKTKGQGVLTLTTDTARQAPETITDKP